MSASPLNRRGSKAAVTPPYSDEGAGLITGAEVEAPAATTSARPSRPLEIVIAAAVLGITGTVFLLSGVIELRAEQPGMTPRSWPRLLGGLGLALSGILLATAVLRPPLPRSELDAATRTGWLRLLLTIGATVAFLVAWPLLGFIVTAPVLISAVTAIGGGRGIRALVIYPVVTAALIYALFNLLLKVPL